MTLQERVRKIKKLYNLADFNTKKEVTLIITGRKRIKEVQTKGGRYE